MHVSVLGSTGGTGQEIVRQSLAKNYQVTAMARNPSMLPISHPNLRVLSGNVFDQNSIANVIQDTDLVISSVGISGIWKARKPHEIYSKGTANIIEALKQTNIQRFIVVSSGGVEPSPGEPWFFKYLLKPFFLENMYADMRIMEASIKASNLDWTIVRPPYLTNGTLKKQYRLSRGKNFIDDKDLSRSDLAHFIVEEIARKEFLRDIVAISY